MTHFVFHVVLLSLVQVDLDEPAAVHLHPDSLSNDLAGEHQVFQDGVVHRGQRAAENQKHVNTQQSSCAWFGAISPVMDNILKDIYNYSHFLQLKEHLKTHQVFKSFD